MHRVISTKKLAPSVAQTAAAAGIALVEQEAIAIRPLRSKEIEAQLQPLLSASHLQHVVFTSVNTVNVVRQYWQQAGNGQAPQWKIFCIAGRTKEALLLWLPEIQIVATAEYGKDLAKKIVESGVQQLIFFCGNRRRDELPALVKQAGITVAEMVVYETVNTPEFLQEPADAVLFFSPSAVQSFFSVNRLAAATVCFAIGHTTAEALTAVTKNTVITSKATSQESLLETVINYFKKVNG